MSTWVEKPAGEEFEVTDFVANGSFATLRENVTYYDEPNYAVLVRIADNSAGFKKSKFVYIDKHSYDFLSKSSLKGGEIIMSNVGSIGKVFICPDLGMPMSLGPNSIVIKTKNNPFYYYYFQSEVFLKKLKGITSQATLAKFNKTGFKTLQVPVPPLPEQERIVKKLDAAFEKIDQLKKNAENGLQAVKDLWQSALREELKPKDGWVKYLMSDLGEIVGGTTPDSKNPEYWNGDKPWISPAELNGEKYLYDSVKKITDKAIKGKGLRLQPKGTVILSSRAPIGKVAISKIDFYCNQGFKNIICGNKLHNEFLYFWLISNVEYLNSLGRGATFKEISKSIVENIPIAIPNIDEQKRIANKLDNIFSLYQDLLLNYGNEISEYETLKQSILRKAFSGQL